MWVDEANLDPIEKAIRAALEKGNPEEGAFRQKIYRSAESALTRSLSARADLTDQIKQTRLSRLQQVIASIETEFTPATVPAVSADKRFEPTQPAPTPRPQEPPFEARRDPDLSRTPNAGHGDSDSAALEYGRTERLDNQESERPANRLFRRLVTAFVLVTILALLVMFGWTAWNSGLFGNAPDDGLGPAKLSEAESSSNAGPQQVGNGTAADENWITVFEPKDAASVQASDGLTAELNGSGPGAYLNIANTAGGTQGEAVFEIGRGVLETLRGNKVVFNVQAKTKDGAATQMAVSCSLAGMGECQRVRFRLEGQLTENLMIVQLSDAAPEASGILTIQPDIDKTGNPVEVTGIRVRVEQ